LLVCRDELKNTDEYAAGLADDAIKAGVAYVTGNRVGLPTR
jgi:hypothetical protein